MVERFVKLFDITEKGVGGTRLVGKEDADNLRGKIVVLNPEQSEIAQKLGINNKGVYGARFR